MNEHQLAKITREAGGSIKPGVERSGTPGSIGIREYEPARAGGRVQSRSIDDGNDLNKPLSPVPRAYTLSGLGSWGSATLHPRLYAFARFAGLIRTDQ
jgi:hypothetical protein